MKFLYGNIVLETDADFSDALPIASAGQMIELAEEGAVSGHPSMAIYLQSNSPAFFALDRSGPHPRITYNQSNLPAAQFRHLTLDLVLPRVLASLGEHVIHGALLSVDDMGLAIVGPSGAGKSTLAAALSHRGAELHSDDITLLHATTSGFFARGAYPSLRLWPDSISHLFPEGCQSIPMSESASKRCMRPSQPATECVALEAIVIVEPTSNELRLSEARPLHACISLVANSFQLDASDVKTASENLSFMRGVALDVPIYVLERPKDYAQLPAICDLVLSIMGSRRSARPARGELHDNLIAL